MPQGLFDQRQSAAAAPDVAEETEAETESEDSVPADARTAEEFDTTSAAERIEAVEAAAESGAETDLGMTIASLGAVTEPGIWLKTPLVTSPAKGRVEYPAKGTAVAVDLIPLEGEPGAGSRLSLAAMRLLEADLTGLPEVRVYRSK